MMYAALQDLPLADGPLLARAAELRPDRQLPHRRRGRPRHRSRGDVRADARRWRPEMADRAPQAFGQALVVRAASSTAARSRRCASYAIGSMIRKYNTCELNAIRAQTDGTIEVAVQECAAGQLLARAHGRYEVMSYKFARRSFLRGVGRVRPRCCCRCCGRSRRAPQALPAPLRLLIIHHPLGAAPGLATWRPTPPRPRPTSRSRSRARRSRRCRSTW